MVQTSTMTMERAPARLALGFAAVFLVFWFAAAEAWGGGVVTWGVDLSAAEKSRMAQLMGIQPGDAVRELLVTNGTCLLGDTCLSFWHPGYLGLYGPWRPAAAWDNNPQHHRYPRECLPRR